MSSYELKMDKIFNLKRIAKDLWIEFGDIPMNPKTECIVIPWLIFPAGTPREEIWRWFEDTLDVRVYDLMFK